MENSILGLQGEDTFFQAEYKIGPFQILHEIGSGKFASVYLGIHEETKEKVAIKQIKKSELNTENLLTSEINIQKILFHPYLCRMYCVIENQNFIFLVNEFCSQGDILKQIIDTEEKFSEEKSCKIFQQIISGLEYLHKNYICHRDIKPENILIDEYGDAKLTDFGLSKSFKNDILLKTACGSPIYAAPEMLIGRPYKGDKCDIWSMGISLYTMVCGELPFDDDDMKTLVYNITRGNYKIPDFLSPSCKDLISKILVTDPEKRITIDEIKKHPWMHIIDFNFMKSPGVFINQDILPVDINTVMQMAGKNKEKIFKIISDIVLNKHNTNTISYYFRNEVKKRNKEMSIANMSPKSKLFLDYINSDISKLKYWNNDIKKRIYSLTEEVMNSFKKEEINQQKVKEEIKEAISLNEPINLNSTKKNNNQVNDKSKNSKFKKSKSFEKFKILRDIKAKKRDSIKKLDEKKKLEIVNQYIGPLIFIHDLIDNIITKVVIQKENKINNQRIKLIPQNASNIDMLATSYSYKKSSTAEISSNLDINKEKKIITEFKINTAETIEFQPSYEKLDRTYTGGFYKFNKNENGITNEKNDKKNNKLSQKMRINSSAVIQEELPSNNIKSKNLKTMNYNKINSQRSNLKKKEIDNKKIPNNKNDSIHNLNINKIIDKKTTYTKKLCPDTNKNKNSSLNKTIDYDMKSYNKSLNNVKESKMISNKLSNNKKSLIPKNPNNSTITIGKNKKTGLIYSNAKNNSTLDIVKRNKHSSMDERLNKNYDFTNRQKTRIYNPMIFTPKNNKIDEYKKAKLDKNLYSGTRNKIKSNILRDKDNKISAVPISKNKQFIKSLTNIENKNISSIDHTKKLTTDKFTNYNLLSQRRSVKKNETNENAISLKNKIKTHRILPEIKEEIKKVVGSNVTMESMSETKTKFKCKKIIGKNIIKFNLYINFIKNKYIISGECLEGELSGCENIFAKIKEKLI